MPKRKFYRTLIQVEVLSEEPLALDEMTLTDVDFAITEGECSGIWEAASVNEEIDGKMCAALLQKQGSDPGFFRLDEDGNDVDDEMAVSDDDEHEGGE